ncbi:MAG: hypothetical protein OEZ39_14605 [Gammaproteobacteria bacterium]|nr:hypothetical protein [Gammaproteobacteria bacterium]MDH5653084.1 hypothetical protein [Gammaproteobacteria bacterium]
MVVAIAKHDIKWLSPSPVWDKIGDLANKDSRDLFVRPTILRFNKDNFMDDMLSLMAYYPDRLIEWKVRPETWREPMPEPKTAARLSPIEPRSTFKKQQRRRLESQQKSKPGNASVEIPVSDLIPDKLLKLYQPAHQRYYLVTASLVCRKRGLPDRIINTGNQEKVSFVLRRLVPRDATTKLEACTPELCDEYAFVQTDNGLQWRNVSQDELYDVEQLMPDEERLPMFSIGFDELNGRNRKLVAGFIPVAKREAYLGAQLYSSAEDAAEDGGVSSPDAITSSKREAVQALFEQLVAAPWKAMISQAANVWEGILEGKSKNQPGDDGEKGKTALNANNVISEERGKIQLISWYLLLDMADFLEKYLPKVWHALFNPALKSGLTDAEEQFYDAMATVTINAGSYCTDNLFINGTPNRYINNVKHGTAYAQADFKTSLIAALAAVKGGSPYDTAKAKILADQLENNDIPYDRSAGDVKTTWPAFLFPFADPLKTDPLPNLAIPAGIDEEPDISHAKIDALTKLMAAAITELKTEAPELLTFKEMDLSTRDGVFVIRCAYERPNCGPFNPPVLSKPSEVFEMASFFDPDAPGRQIRIPMPLDISPAGLRKYNKNAGFMISDMLCGKIRNIRKITFGDLVLSVLPWPFHKDLPTPSKTGPCGKPGNSFGMFCSLSIPIVTLCALILLIIMVTLFDIFFKWLPLLFVCFPLFGLKGKKS